MREASSLKLGSLDWTLGRQLKFRAVWPEKVAEIIVPAATAVVKQWVAMTNDQIPITNR
jgi:hypothetical protein